MKFDLHTHHHRCGHATGSIRDYIESAIEKGLQVIGISDHSPYFAYEEDQPYPKIAMRKSEFLNYIDEVLQLKKEYEGRIEVLLGLESDFFPEHAALYKEHYQSHPFDYTIGSVHFVDDVSIFNKNRWTQLTEEEQIAVKERYYHLIQQSARSAMFNILGHIDAMKANYPTFSDIPTPIIDDTLQVISEHQVAIEINTSGITKMCGGWYPSDDILERALHYGVDVTFGSDAHKVERVGDQWEQVAAKLKEIGFKHWVFYRQRQRQVVNL